VLAVVAVVALWRPAGRPFEDWAFVLLRYWAIPRIAVWRIRPSAAATEEDDRLEVLLPDVGWSASRASGRYGEEVRHGAR
jgi:hypothetical protein